MTRGRCSACCQHVAEQLLSQVKSCAHQAPFGWSSLVLTEHASLRMYSFRKHTVFACEKKENRLLCHRLNASQRSWSRFFCLWRVKLKKVIVYVAFQLIFKQVQLFVLKFRQKAFSALRLGSQSGPWDPSQGLTINLKGHHTLKGIRDNQKAYFIQPHLFISH